MAVNFQFIQIKPPSELKKIFSSSSLHQQKQTSKRKKSSQVPPKPYPTLPSSPASPASPASPHAPSCPFPKDPLPRILILMSQWRYNKNCKSIPCPFTRPNSLSQPWTLPQSSKQCHSKTPGVKEVSVCNNKISMINKYSIIMAMDLLSIPLLMALLILWAKWSPSKRNPLGRNPVLLLAIQSQPLWLHWNYSKEGSRSPYILRNCQLGRKMAEKLSAMPKEFSFGILGIMIMKILSNMSS